MQLDLHIPTLAGPSASGTLYGYANYVRQTVDALAQVGIEFTAAADRALYLGPPHLMPIMHKPVIVGTMWEVAQMPTDVVRHLRRADGLVVPSHFCQTIFRRAGLHQPIHVAPLGIDPDEWPDAPVWRQGADPIKMLWVGARTHRKGWPMLWDAWRQGFTPKDRVHLTIKTSVDEGEAPVPSWRFHGLHFMADRLSWDALRALYRQHHVFLCTSVAEGWGLPTLEAMACGLLVISPRHTGLAEFVHKGVAWVVETERVGIHYGRSSTALAPKVSHLKALMRRAVEEFDTTEPLRVRAQVHAKQFTWRRSAEAWLDALARPMRAAG